MINILTELKKLVINPISEEGKKLKIVYTPLHGTGNLPVRRILKELGFEQCICCTGTGTSGFRIFNSRISKSGRSEGIYPGKKVGE